MFYGKLLIWRSSLCNRPASYWLYLVWTDKSFLHVLQKYVYNHLILLHQSKAPHHQKGSHYPSSVCLFFCLSRFAYAYATQILWKHSNMPHESKEKSLFQKWSVQHTKRTGHKDHSVCISRIPFRLSASPCFCSTRNVRSCKFYWVLWRTGLRTPSCMTVVWHWIVVSPGRRHRPVKPL